MKKQITIAAVILTLGTGAAFAAMQGGKSFFSRIDADGNGSISKAEAEVMGAKHFSRLDDDESGTLTLDEMSKMRGMRGGHHGDGGGKWAGKSEGRGEGGRDRDARIEKRFERLDADNNGAVTLEEMKAAADSRDAKRAARKAERFAELDADGNGEVSKAEFVSQSVDKMFARMDTDESGDITKEEMQAVRKAMWEARKTDKAE